MQAQVKKAKVSRVELLTLGRQDQQWWPLGRAILFRKHGTLKYEAGVLLITSDFPSALEVSCQ